MFRRSILPSVLSLLMILSFASVTHARGFDAIGARGNGMGGAGVAQIDDENAPQWNPANLTLPSSTRGYEDDAATSLGFQLGAQVQSTNNFLRNSQDLVDFYDLHQGTGVFEGDYTTGDNRARFFELVSLVRDIEGDDQGALFNATAGFPNARHSNWSVSLNNITDAAAYTDIDLTGGLRLDTGAVQDGFGDGGSNPSGTPSPDYESVRETCESNFNQGSWDPGFFGISSSKSDLAGFIAQYAEGNGVSKSEATKFCESGNQILDQSVDAIQSGASTSDNFDTDAQRVIFEGASITEAAFSYARPEPVAEVAGAPIYVGGSARIMQGRVAYVEDNPFQTDASDSTDEVFDEDEDVETSTNFGLDLGVTYDARDTLGFKAGLVGKYLNSPDFDYPDESPDGESSVTVDPQVRLGLSAYPLDFMPVDVGSDWWQLSADYDVTKNETILQNYEKQYVAVGNEFNVVNSFWWNLALRAGVRKNLAESAEGNLFTAGVGLQMAGLNVEVSGVMSDKTTRDEDGDEQPTLAGGSLNLAYRF